MNDGLEKKDGWIARAAVFGVLWFIGVFFFCGDLGKWADDWGFHVRDPVTNDFLWRDVFALDHFHLKFWRPLHIRVGCALQTVLWEHDWAIHLIVAAVHGINAWLLWRVLGRLCGSARAAAAGALLFLVFPAGHEAMFWMSTIGTTVGVCWFLMCALGVQRFAAGEIGPRGLLLHLPLLLTLGWWYEQPAACAPALALVYFACARADVPVRRRVRGAAMVFAAGMVAGVVYAALLVATAPPSSRGGAGKIIQAGQLLGQIDLIWSQAWRQISLVEFAQGAMEEGVRELRSRRAETLIAMLALGGAGVGFGRWWMKGRGDIPLVLRDHTEIGVGECPRVQRGASLLFGACIVGASFVPVVAVQGQWFASRLAYMPVLGLVVMLAVALDAAFARPWAVSRTMSGRVWRGATLVALMAALWCCAVMLVGVQSVWRKQSKLNASVVQELRERVPNPPRDAMLVPVGIRGWSTKTTSGTFERIIPSAFEMPWSAELIVQFAYGRADVHVPAFSRWVDPTRGIAGCLGAVESGLVFPVESYWNVSYAITPGLGKVVPWSKVSAFRIVPGGHVRMVGAVRIEDAENPAVERVVRIGDGLVNQGEADARRAVVAAARVVGEKPMTPAWVLGGAAGSTAREKARPGQESALGRTNAAYTMHPMVATIGDRAELSAAIPASGKQRVVAMRVALLNMDASISDGVSLTIELGDEPMVLAREQITPERMRKEGRWLVVRAEVPPMGAERMLRVRIGPGAKGNANGDWCFVTPPVVVDSESGGAGK